MSVAHRPLIETANNSSAIADRLARDGFGFVPGPAMLAAAEALGGTDWNGYAASWDALEPDRFMADGGTYRKRRFACFALADGVLRRKPAQPHFQTRDNNPLNGGIARVFAPVTDIIADHPMNRALLRLCADAFAAVRPAPAWHVEMHQFRIEAQTGTGGLPTPEGTHRDGVDFVLTLMVERANVAGGASTVVGEDGAARAEATLQEPLDSYLIDDRRMLHAVSPVHPIDPSRPGTRDMLVLTFRAEEF
ncbi:2OG-Fe dioxygenase family protein [Lichenihabitans sp. Uapishka_5]|uniref:2OG-Fe dioxygenase family protein n=1 Tax=Lichenihabitans sp. Uapishka_5 TaxID=3037302 RepID=UPI0029E7EEC2|nr:2OG-Fe dioxygenase family protein [Lichenihabitans sp. Uapishka_5]MDX7952636.1 2OG-Fe dioxygenase family protein [Lichenihabitans sp. Uapishka_5]